MPGATWNWTKASVSVPDTQEERRVITREPSLLRRLRSMFGGLVHTR